MRKIKKNLFLMCTRTSNRQKRAISKAKPQDFSEQNLQKQHLKRTLLIQTEITLQRLPR